MIGYGCVRTVVLLMAMTVLQGCVLGTPLLTESMDRKKIEGTYDLYLYGCRYPSDYEHAAFLISSNARYPVSFVVFETAYTVKKGLPAEQALSEAEAFARCGIQTVDETRVRRIPDGGGGTIGYELLPRYPVTDLVGPDPLMVNYALKDGVVKVYIRLYPDVERKLNRTGTSTSGGR